MKFVPSIIPVYLPRSDERVEPVIHKFFWEINDRGDCSIWFFKTAVDQEIVQTQWFNKAGDVACGYEKSNKSDNECSTVREWYTKNGSEWLRSPIWEQWF